MSIAESFHVWRRCAERIQEVKELADHPTVTFQAGAAAQSVVKQTAPYVGFVSSIMVYHLGKDETVANTLSFLGQYGLRGY